MKLKFENIIEKIIAGVILAAILSIADIVFTGNFSFQVLVFGFLLGFIVATIFISVYGKKLLPETIMNTLQTNLTESEGAIIKELVQATRHQHSSDVVKTVREVLPNIKSSISSEDVISIVNNAIHSSDKVEIIEMLSPKIRRPLTKPEVKALLLGLHSSDRSRASVALSRRFHTHN